LGGLRKRDIWGPKRSEKKPKKVKRVEQSLRASEKIYRATDEVEGYSDGGARRLLGR